MAYLIGVDTGGTFTDCVVVDEQGRLTFGKAPSTPPDFAVGVLGSVGTAAESLGMSLRELLEQSVLFSHGTTVATNAMLTRSGAKTGLITTQGFEDIIIMMRAIGRVVGLSEENIKHMVATNKPDPIVPRPLIKGVAERVDYKGAVLRALDREGVRRAIKELVDEGVEAIAISFLWSFMNPTHEREVLRLVKEMYPGVFVTISSDLTPKLGEYERTATTAINAYVGPTTSRYISSLADQLKGGGFPSIPLIMQAYGGCLHAERAVERPVEMIGSGPAAGVIGSKFMAELIGYTNVITTDVGGTSFDVGLIYRGVPELAKEPSIGQYRLMVPSIEVKSIGAGGGSIAWVEPVTNLLKVGPRSAGARPGPICYDIGGTEPTVTDADLVLGYLNPDYFLGGKMKLNKDKAYQAIESLGRPLGMSPVETAAAIYDIVNAHMSDLVRDVTVNRGYDPRGCVLFAFGGAGPLHASEYGREAQAVIVPCTASVHSAMGTLAGDVMHVYELSDPMVAPFDVERFNKDFQGLEAAAIEDLRRDGFRDDEMSTARYCEMRYARQIHELRVPVPGGRLSAADLEQLIERFERLYEDLYGKGSAFREAGIHLETFVVEGMGAIRRPDFVKHPLNSSDPSVALKTRRDIFLRKKGDFVSVPVYDFDRLEAGNVVQGPAIIETPITTILVDMDQKGAVDQYLNVVITKEA